MAEQFLDGKRVLFNLEQALGMNLYQRTLHIKEETRQYSSSAFLGAYDPVDHMHLILTARQRASKLGLVTVDYPIRNIRYKKALYGKIKVTITAAGRKARQWAKLGGSWDIINKDIHFDGMFEIIRKDGEYTQAFIDGIFSLKGDRFAPLQEELMFQIMKRERYLAPA